MKMKKRFLSILLSLVMVLGLVPGMSLTAYAETTTVTWSSNDAAFPGFPNGISVTGVKNGNEKELYSTGDESFSTTLGKFTKIEVTGGWLQDKRFNGSGWSGRIWTGNASTVSYS